MAFWPSRRPAACPAAVLLTAALTAAILAQQPVFRTGVEVVRLDVTVVDRSSRPVDNLLPGDFIVTVDRAPRTVVSAAFVRYGPAAGGDRTEARPAPARAADSVVAPLGATGRTIVIAVDEDSFDAGTAMATVRAARRFLEGLPGADRVGVVAIPRLPSAAAISTDRAAARRAMDALVAGPPALVPGPYVIGLQEAFDMERRDAQVTERVLARECARTIDPVSCPLDVRTQARQMVFLAQMRSQASIDAVQQIAETLRKVPGPKTLVVVSGGMTDPEAFSAYSHLADALAAGQVSLYTVFVERMHAGQARSLPSPTQVEDDRLESNGVENLTAAAGGTVVRVAGQIEVGFDRVATELSGAYVLGIEVAASDRDGKPHQVEVKVRRTGLDVRARKQYVIETASAAGGAAPAATMPPNPASRAAATAPDLEPVLARASEYVAAYGTAFPALLCEEQTEQTLFAWKAAPAAPRGTWVVETRRQVASDFLLLRLPSGAGWTAIRDVFEVDGRATRSHDDRLRQMLLTAPDEILELTRDLARESAGHDIGFVQRNTNAPPSALLFLAAANRSRSVFARLEEQVLGGTRVVVVAYAERASPTLVRGDSGDLPAQGEFWLDPRTGRVHKSVLRLDVGGTIGEITVTYRPTTGGGPAWVPTEMVEVYTDGPRKFESRARYANFRVFN